METICICGRTALGIWQRLRLFERPGLDELRPLACRARELGMAPGALAHAGSGLGDPDAIRSRLASRLPVPLAPPAAATPSAPLLTSIELLVSSQTDRHRANGKSLRLWSGALPPGAFLKLEDELYLSSPEFVFLLLAQELEPARLARLGFEMCGSYALGRPGVPGAPRCQALTSSARIADFLTRAGSVRDGAKARRAARLIADGSGSPAETAMVALLCTPRARGGYGLPLPAMNRRVEVPERSRTAAGRERLYLDSFWPSAGFALEYDGEAFHTAPQDVAYDRARRNCLVDAGITLVSIDKGILLDAARFDAVARQVARAIQYRLPKKAFDGDWARKRDALRRQVLGR